MNHKNIKWHYISLSFTCLLIKCRRTFNIIYCSHSKKCMNKYIDIDSIWNNRQTIFFFQNKRIFVQLNELDISCFVLFFQNKKIFVQLNELNISFFFKIKRFSFNEMN